MTEKQLKKYKDILMKERVEILKELADSDESVRDLLENDAHNVNDSIDDATTTITQNILNIVSSKNQQTLLAIESALRRIAEGSFGKCITCGSQITAVRLEAIPWATKCIDCKTKDEKRK